MTPSCNRSTTFRNFAECHLYPQQFWLPVIATSRALKLRTRVAVAQRIEPSNDSGDGCGFESHQSHASSEALGFSHLEPLSSLDPGAQMFQSGRTLAELFINISPTGWEIDLLGAIWFF